MNEQEKKITKTQKKWGKNLLLPFIEACPQVIRPEADAEIFVEDLCKAITKFSVYNNTVNELLPFVKACPQIFKPGIGAETFAGELGRAVVKFAEFLEEPIN